MSYPYDGTSEYTSSEIRQMYNNGEISKDEAKHLENANHNGHWDADDNWVPASRDYDD